jgi:holin-like protein
MMETPERHRLVEGFAILVGFQLAGEVIARTLHLPVPAAVLGMLLLFLWLLLRDRLPRGLHAAAGELLDNLALLFVPATVGAFLGIGAIAHEAVAAAFAVVASTFLAMAATAWTFLALERRRKDGR